MRTNTLCGGQRLPLWLSTPLRFFAAFSLLFFLFSAKSFAQMGCPGCAVLLPPGLPEDTVYLEKIPDAVRGEAYDQSISFRLPKTTTPVHEIDSTTPAGLPISKFVIAGLDNVPPGLNWQPSQVEFSTSDQTDGCLRFCGTPLVADTFLIVVKLKATVLFTSQNAQFTMRMVVNPAGITTDGFTMSNVEGCAPLTTAFVNNLPSNGNPGYSYTWDFGDGQGFAGENPPPHTFAAPGTYTVSYTANADTSGYILTSITILNVGCSDVFSGNPDLFFFIKDAAGQKVFSFPTSVQNTQLPITFPVNLKIGLQVYNLQVWDEDGGVEGADDFCGEIFFNQLAKDTISNGPFRVVLHMIHPNTEVKSSGTVVVHETPAQPSIASPDGLTACAGIELTLQSSNATGNQWFMNGQALFGAMDATLMPSESGAFQVKITNSFGCSAVSDSVQITFIPLPFLPVYKNNKNLLSVLDTNTLPSNYALQWFSGPAPIPGETGLTYCVKSTATYGLEVTDTDTGCKNYFEATIVYNPAFDCTVGTFDLAVGQLAIFPNPTSGLATISFPSTLTAPTRLRVFDVSGKMLREMDLPSGISRWELDCGGLPDGIFQLEMLAGANRFVGKLVVLN